MKSSASLFRHRALWAVAAACAVLLGFKLLGVLVYDTNDDTIMAALSYGYYGSPQGKLVYIHPVLGGLLALLQTWVPKLPWYYLFELGLLTAAMAGLFYLVLDRDAPGKLPALTLLALFFVYAVLFRMQYTKLAGAAAATGCLMIFHSLRKGKWVPGVLGELMAIAGFCLRRDAFFLVLIPLFSVGAALLWDLTRRDKKRALCLIGAFLALFALCGGLMLAEKQSYSAEDWQAYQRYNSLRTELLDYGFPDYEENRNLYESLSISKEDLALFQSWDFGDPEIFNEETMAALCGAKPGRHFSLGIVKEAIRGLVSYDFSGLLLCAVLLGLCFGSKKGLIQSLYALGALFATEILLLYLGRGLRERVDVPLMLAVMAVLLTVGMDKIDSASLSRRAAALLSAALVLTQIPGLIARKDDATERYVGASHLHSAFQVLSSDKSRLYLTRTDELPPDRLPGKQGAVGYLENISPLGGWLTESPYETARYAAYGVANPFRDLINRADVRLLSNEVSPVLDYIQRHYAPDAQAVPVRLVNGEYTVFRILAEAPSIPPLPQGDNGLASWSLEPQPGGKLTGTMSVPGENSFAADIYVTLTAQDGTQKTLLSLQTPQAGLTLSQGRYGAFSLDAAPGTYQVTLTLAGSVAYTIDAGTVQIS